MSKSSFRPHDRRRRPVRENDGQAVRLAAEEKNVAGGVDGKKVFVIVEDDKAKVDKGNSAVEKLVGIDRMWGFIGAVFSTLNSWIFII